jgi:hypothetical protein
MLADHLVSFPGFDIVSLRHLEGRRRGCFGEEVVDTDHSPKMALRSSFPFSIGESEILGVGYWEV